MSSAAPNPVPAGTEPVELTAVGCKGNDEQRHDTNPTPKPEDSKENVGCFAKVAAFVAATIPPGGIAASAFNIGSTTVGAGIFGLPAASQSSGLVMAMFYLLVITAMAVFSTYALGVAADRSKVNTYEGVARVLLGKWGAYITAAARVFMSLSGCVAYVISTGDILHAILKNSSASDFLKTTAGNRLLTFIMWLCCMLPLVIPRHIDSLRHASTVAFVLMIYMVAVVVVHSCMNGLPENIKSVSVGRNESAEVVLFNSGNTAIEGLGVFIFAYVFQVTAYEVYMDMKDRSVRKLVIATIIAMAMCLPMYALTALFGYLDFGSKATSSILLMYDPLNEPEVLIGYVGVLVMLFVSYALLGMSCRNALYSLIGWDANTVAFWKHCIAVVSLSVVMLVCGLFIPKINTVLGFAGSISGAFLAFIFPALFLMYSGGFTLQKVGPLCYIATYVLLLSGIIAAVFGTGATIYGVVVG
ncbi:unnamed protein product [Trypanosoma congolense IL3000]|uniref:WGS project CAEQ00000000 data, annotated contig 524 n=1 Tax=Trypanosoma congolense (strain IL3000) TaxID=1068625 RepID=F9WGP1_TRYCI|nr:unnamed protein product [Trypanosoma congolense IL3000]